MTAFRTRTYPPLIPPPPAPAPAKRGQGRQRRRCWADMPEVWWKPLSRSSGMTRWGGRGYVPWYKMDDIFCSSSVGTQDVIFFFCFSFFWRVKFKTFFFSCNTQCSHCCSVVLIASRPTLCCKSSLASKLERQLLIKVSVGAVSYFLSLAVWTVDYIDFFIYTWGVVEQRWCPVCTRPPFFVRCVDLPLTFRQTCPRGDERHRASLSSPRGNAAQLLPVRCL